MLSKTYLFQASHIVQRQMATFPCCYFLLTKRIALGVKDVRRFLTVYPQDIWNPLVWLNPKQIAPLFPDLHRWSDMHCRPYLFVFSAELNKLQAFFWPTTSQWILLFLGLQVPMPGFLNMYLCNRNSSAVHCSGAVFKPVIDWFHGRDTKAVAVYIL